MKNLREYEVYKSIEWGMWVVQYIYNGFNDLDYRGTHGLGIKMFDSEYKAIRSGERYKKL